MLYGIFTVFDKKLESYMQPFFSVNTATALRAFADACSDEGSMLFKHPGDFQLYKIAEYNDQTADIESHPPVPIAKPETKTEKTETTGQIERLKI